jgi:hypothetical protein
MKFLSEIFQDNVGGFSSKRFITIFAFGLFAFNFIMDLLHDKQVSENILDLTFYLIVAGLGVITAEKFTKSEKGIHIEGSADKKPE